MTQEIHPWYEQLTQHPGEDVWHYNAATAYKAIAYSPKTIEYMTRRGLR